MRDETAELDANQEAALVALLATRTVRDAAKKAKVAESTFWRWMQLPAFQSRYRAARRQLVESAIARLQNDATVAVDTLKEIAKNKKAPAAARVTAARTILDHSLGAVELTDLMERVEQLEAATGGGQRKRA